MEPATFWLVAYCLNQLHYCVPPIIIVDIKKIKLEEFNISVMSVMIVMNVIIIGSMWCNITCLFQVQTCRKMM
jgi:hypothetical protein